MNEVITIDDDDDGGGSALVFFYSWFPSMAVGDDQNQFRYKLWLFIFRFVHVFVSYIVRVGITPMRKFMSFDFRVV